MKGASKSKRRQKKKENASSDVDVVLTRRIYDGPLRLAQAAIRAVLTLKGVLRTLRKVQPARYASNCSHMIFARHFTMRHFDIALYQVHDCKKFLLQSTTNPRQAGASIQTNQYSHNSDVVVVVQICWLVAEEECVLDDASTFSEISRATSKWLVLV